MVVSSDDGNDYISQKVTDTDLSRTNILYSFLVGHPSDVGKEVSLFSFLFPFFLTFSTALSETFNTVRYVKYGT